MARRDRNRSTQWHYPGSTNRFDGRRRLGSVTDPDPISKSFTRKIIRCKRCGSRVVSNVNHCPFCGKSLQPLFKRFWFWLVVIVLIGALTVALVILTPTIELSQKPPKLPPPVVVGAPEGASIKDLELGTTVDYNSLLVTVMENSLHSTSSDGLPITAIKVQFLNKSDADVMLYLTQWQLETTDGTRVEHYIGKTDQGEGVSSELDSRILPKGGTVTGTLYFAASDPHWVVFAPDALSGTEAEWVTWLLSDPPTTGD